MTSRALLTLSVSVALAAALAAAVPARWETAGTAAFLTGELEDVAVDAAGRLTLAPGSTVLHDPGLPFVWELAEAADGSLYAGTGNDGQVIRVDAAGRASVVFDADQLEVHALATAPGGGVFAGTSPAGAVYHVDAAATERPVFDPPERYIWSLAVDPAGNLFIGTGDPGLVYRVTPQGQSSVFYRATATHITALAFDREGRLLVGTESPARVIRLDAGGAPFVVLESDHTEIRRLRLAPDGSVYALATTAKPAPATPKPAVAAPAPAAATAPAGSPTVTVQVTAVSTPGDDGGTTTTAGSGDGRGAVYHIQPDGLWDVHWDAQTDVPYDIALEASGSLLVATGNKGRLYRLAGRPAEASVLTRQPAQHLTALLRTRAGALVYASANPGRILRLDTAAARTGTYFSEVRDAQVVATWGVMRWRAAVPAGATLEVSTRTGNTSTPDETWSAWSPAYDTPDGSPITSPKARHLQWRLRLAATGDAPVVTSVDATYLPRNTAPRVTSLTVHPPGVVFQKPYPSGDPDLAGYDLDPPARKILTAGTPREATAVGKKEFAHGLLTLQWKAEDEAGDALQFDVLYRREGEAAWQPIRRGLLETLMVWDTAAVPDGRYVVRVQASDGPTNSPATARSGFMDSALVTIDNTPPVVRISGTRREGTTAVLSIEASDAGSPLTAVEYTVDGERWTPLYAADGLTDTRAERFELRLDTTQAGRSIVIRATDSLHNTGRVSAGTASLAP